MVQRMFDKFAYRNISPEVYFAQDDPKYVQAAEFVTNIKQKLMDRLGA